MRITKSRLYVFKLLINVAFEDETTVKNGGVRGRGLILVKNHPLPPPYARRGKVPILGEAFIELFRFIMSYFPLLFEEGTKGWWLQKQGNSTVKTEPLPSSLRTEIDPLCNVMICSAIARPKPLPGVSARAVSPR